MAVEIVHWNPVRSRLPGRVARRIPFITDRINNFGDLLGPMIVKRILERRGLKDRQGHQQRLLTVGSILQFSQDGDVVWGSGALDDIHHRIGHVKNLDVRAVRGPISRSILMKLGHSVPAIFGDPGLLLGQLWNPQDFYDEALKSDFVVIPNHGELDKYQHMAECVDPTSDINEVLARIASARCVISSSLHGIVVAEAFGIDAKWLASRSLNLTKYWDYYLGTGRMLPDPLTSVEQALSAPAGESPKWDSGPLLEAFPVDLWESSCDSRNS